VTQAQRTCKTSAVTLQRCCWCFITCMDSLVQLVASLSISQCSYLPSRLTNAIFSRIRWAPGPITECSVVVNDFSPDDRNRDLRSKPDG